MRPVAIATALILMLLLPVASCDSGIENDAAPDESGSDKSDLDSCERIPLEPVELPEMGEGPSVVTMDENNFFVVNGTRFFPYGFYGFPTTEEGMEEFVASGFNATVFYGSCCEGDTLQTHIDTLEWLSQYGVWGAGHGFWPVDQIYSETPETLRSWLDARNEVGSTLFWYTYDEPGIWNIPKQEAQDYYELLHELDPGHPNALVMCVNEDFTEYMDYTDFMMVDPYPVPWMPLSQVKYTVIEAHEASGGAKGVFGVEQAFDWYVGWNVEPEGHVWRPLVSELRNMTYQFLIFGVNGLVYFAYPYVHEQTERWEGLVQVASEVRELMPVLLEVDSDVPIAQEPDLPYVDHVLKEHDGLYYLMVVSTWFNDLTVSYDLTPLGQDLCVVEYFSGEPVQVSDQGRITLDLAKDQEAVLQIIPR